MRRFLLLLVLPLLACRALFPSSEEPPGASITITPTPGSPSFPVPPAAPPTAFPPVTQVAPLESAPAVTEANSFAVRLHPDGPLYSGDQVSLEVIPPPGARIEGQKVRVEMETRQGEKGAEEEFNRYGIGNRLQATFKWAWDTSGLPAGEHTLTFSIPPDGPTWTETVTLLPASQAPPPEPQADWATAESSCCRLHYVTGTAAERDLPALMEMADEQAKTASQSLGAGLSEPIDITFMPRLLGHGGFTGQEIAISYLDRNYAAADTATILHHEIVHLLDGRLGGELRPIMLVEGLAVYLTGGHYKPEPLKPRAAALLPPDESCQQASAIKVAALSQQAGLTCGLGWYIPLNALIDDFYASQHEIGYLEAGALIEFMVDTWGWQAFSDFYRDIHPQRDMPDVLGMQGGAQYRAINVALREHFGITVEQLEQRFQQDLRQERPSPEMVEDVRLTVSFYDTVRRYQQSLDPSAYFLTAWVPDDKEMRQRGIVADILRRPARPENLALETMLVEAGARLQEADFEKAWQLVEAANAVLGEISASSASPFAAHPLAADYMALVQAAQAAGYQAQRIQVEDQTARVWGTTTGPQLAELDFKNVQGDWILVQEAGFSWPNLHSYRALAGCLSCEAGYSPR